MGFTIDYNHDHDSLVATFSGRLTYDQAEPCLKQIKAAGDAKGTTQWITDLRRVDITLYRQELVALPLLIREYGMATWRRGIVIDEGVSDTIAIYIAAAQMRGQHVMVFTRLDEALARIGSPNAEIPHDQRHIQDPALAGS